MRSHKTAFSIVEMIVATALLAVISVAICTVLNYTSTISTRTTAKLNAATVARDCLDLIGRDLAVAKVPLNRTSTKSYQMLINPDGAIYPDVQVEKWQNPHMFFWQIPATNDSSIELKHGDASIVGYLVLQDLKSKPKRLQLRRIYVDAATIGDRADGTTDDYATEPRWVNEGLLELYAPTESNNDNYTGWVADGVLAMWVRPLDRGGAVIHRIMEGPPPPATRVEKDMGYVFDSRAGYISTNYQTSKELAAVPAFPAFIEVSLVCVAPQDVERITTMPVYNAVDPNKFEDEVAKFVTSVKAANPGLGSIGAFSRRFRIYNSN